MSSQAVLSAREAEEADRGRLANLLHFESHVHRHLDWRHPLDWLGKRPFLVAENSGRINAALACPPDPPEVAWLRLFAVSSRLNLEDAWQGLWPKAKEKLDTSVKNVVSIPLHNWLESLLKDSRFDHSHNVVVLEWQPDFEKRFTKDENQAVVRTMRNEDLAEVRNVDNKGFPTLWQHSLETIQMAFTHCSYATVIEIDEQVVAYQLSTVGSHGLHLARLAVSPEWQGKHLAQTLVQDLQNRIVEQQIHRLTVNTQDSNNASLALYEKAGFEYTQESHPVFQLEL